MLGIARHCHEEEPLHRRAALHNVKFQGRALVEALFHIKLTYRVSRLLQGLAGGISLFRQGPAGNVST